MREDETPKKQYGILSCVPRPILGQRFIIKSSIVPLLSNYPNSSQKRSPPEDTTPTGTHPQLPSLKVLREMGWKDTTHIKPAVDGIPKALGHPTVKKKMVDQFCILQSHGKAVDNYHIPTPKIIYGQGPTMQSYPSKGKDSRRSLNLPEQQNRRGLGIIPVESIIEQSNRERPICRVSLNPGIPTIHRKINPFNKGQQRAKLLVFLHQ